MEESKYEEAIGEKIVKYTVEDWYNLPEDRRVELIDGELFDMATSTRVHQGLVSQLTTTINNHIRKHDGTCKVYPAPFSVQLSKEENTIVEPDISIICDKDKLTDRGCLGAPDWVIEIISPSTASMDYVRKRELYMNAGVREYWIVNPETGDVTIYHDDQPYIPKSYRLTDKIRSYIYDDLEIDFNEIMQQI